MKPEQLLYSKTHEWVAVSTDSSGTKIATVGITAFTLESLTDLVFIDLPAPGRKVKAGEPFGEVESVKAVSDLYSPLSGEIVDVNGELPNHLDQLHDDPYGSGWIMKIKVNDESELSQLLSHAAYEKQCAEEGH